MSTFEDLECFLDHLSVDKMKCTVEILVEIVVYYFKETFILLWIAHKLTFWNIIIIK